MHVCSTVLWRDITIRSAHLHLPRVCTSVFNHIDPGPVTTCCGGPAAFKSAYEKPLNKPDLPTDWTSIWHARCAVEASNCVATRNPGRTNWLLQTKHAVPRKTVVLINVSPFAFAGCLCCVVSKAAERIAGARHIHGPIRVKGILFKKLREVAAPVFAERHKASVLLPNVCHERSQVRGKLARLLLAKHPVNVWPIRLANLFKRATNMLALFQEGFWPRPGGRRRCQCSLLVFAMVKRARRCLHRKSAPAHGCHSQGW